MLFSCSPERKLAKQFVQDKQQPSLLVLMPDIVFKENIKKIRTVADDADSIENPLFLDKIMDAEVLNRFKMVYQKELKQYNVNIYDDSTFENFLKVDSNAWMVNLTQIEFQEYNTAYNDKEDFLGTEYTSEVPLNAFNSAYWFELSKVNAPDTIKPAIMFGSNDLLDRFTGEFIMDIFTGVMTYNLDIDTITMDNFYSQIDFSARLYAGYTYDYLLNNFIQQHFPSDSKSDKYYRYDPYRNKIFMALEDKFVPLGQ